MLLQNCWVELFVIGFAQSSHIISVPTVMSSLTNFMNNAIAQEKMAASKLKKLSEHIWKVNEFIHEITKMDVDDTEFALLRFIVLFNPGELFFGTLLFHHLEGHYRSNSAWKDKRSAKP